VDVYFPTGVFDVDQDHLAMAALSG